MTDGTTGDGSDPIRRLMEMVAQNKAALGATNDPSVVSAVELTEQARSAAQTAEAVLAADPATGPVDVIYIGANEDVVDRRFLLVLFGGERAFLFDRDTGQTIPTELDDRGLAGEARLEANLASARAIARRERLSRVYVVRHS